MAELVYLVAQAGCARHFLFILALATTSSFFDKKEIQERDGRGLPLRHYLPLASSTQRRSVRDNNIASTPRGASDEVALIGHTRGAQASRNQRPDCG